MALYRQSEDARGRFDRPEECQRERTVDFERLGELLGPLCFPASRPVALPFGPLTSSSIQNRQLSFVMPAIPSKAEGLSPTTAGRRQSSSSVSRENK